MGEEEKFTCPKCGALVSKGDRFCKNCGASLVEVSEVFTEVPLTEHVPEEVYERKLSLTQRFYKLLTVPSEAMQDIALAPDYEGFVLITVMEIVLVSADLALVLQKIQLVGENAGKVSGLVTGFLILAVVLGIGIYVVKWLIKSLIVKYACDSGSAWNFKTAASITGYAYLPEIITGLIGTCVSWFLIPSMTINTTNLQAAMQTVESYRAQLNWLKLFSFFGLIWKSYLGGLGARFGTKEKCSLGTGIAVFFVLGLISLLISFAIQ
jgi:hypothetical protein